MFPDQQDTTDSGSFLQTSDGMTALSELSAVLPPHRFLRPDKKAVAEPPLP